MESVPVIYYCFVDKESFTGEPVRLTTGKNATAPVVVPFGLDGGLILWNTGHDGLEATDTLCYARYTADGQVGEVKRAKGLLSDCAPVYHDGKYTWYTTTENGQMTFYSIDTAGKVTKRIAVAPESPDFWDVPQSAWYAQAVDHVVEQGLMRGVDEYFFEPVSKSTRAMIVQMLYRMEGEPGVSDCPFGDVAPNAWYSESVAWAAGNQIVKGIGGNRFGPNVHVTREQLAVMLYSYAKFRGQDTSASMGLGSFTDAGRVSGWAKEALQWAAAESLVQGKQDGSAFRLDPQGQASRAEIAQVFMRFCERFQ